MTFRFGDPDADFLRRDREQTEWLKRRPVCACCRQHIQEEKLMHIEADFYHLTCAIETFGEDTEEYL